MRGPLLLLAAAFAALAAVPAGAQTRPAAAKEYRVEIEPGSVQSRMREGGRFVSLRFRITRLADSANVTSVPKEEIVVEEEGARVAELEIKQPRAAKLTVVLAVDISFSMERNNKIHEAKQAALTFLDKLDDQADVGLILFDHQVKAADAVAPAGEHADQKDHRARLRRLIHDAKPRGGTAYLDATVEAVKMLKARPGRKAVVVLTDGVDVNSTATLPEAIKAAQIAELPVYTVGIGEPGRNDPVTTVLVLDRSGSMMDKADNNDDRTKFEALKAAAKRFVHLMRPSSKSTVLSFSDRLDNPEPFTNDRASLEERINRLRAFGGTLLYDASFAGLETLLAENPPGRKAVVVLTDGRDEFPGSRRSDADVIARAREAKVPLHMLGLGRPHEINEPVMRRMATETGGQYYHAGTAEKLIDLFEDLSIRLHDDGIDEAALKRLAEETGGRYTPVKDISQLRLIYERLADELQSTYEVTFKSRRSDHDGTARTIAVKVLRDGVVISEGGEGSDVARGIVVPQMDYAVYLAFLGGLVGLLVLPLGLKRRRG